MEILEKYNKISWAFAFLIAIAIFYISSLSFESAPAGGYGWKTIAYHFLAFFSLAFFLLPAMVKGKSKKLIFLAIILAVLYGISDEIHQYFVPGRHMAFSDVIINSCGILTASLIYTIFLSSRKSRDFQKLPKNSSENHRKNNVKPNP